MRIHSSIENSEITKTDLRATTIYLVATPTFINRIVRKQKPFLKPLMKINIVSISKIRVLYVQSFSYSVPFAAYLYVSYDREDETSQLQQ